MPEVRDHAITNRARSILLRRWVDAGRLAWGSVNGVLYLRGCLRRNPLFPVQKDAAADELLLLHALERDLKAIEGVKDVIFELEGFERKGDHWERTTLPIGTSAS